MSRFTNLGTVSQEEDCSVCGVDGNGLQLN